ncbi:MAG: MBL fold metallo-hydrolase [Deferrisomatales bacterium]|nr:MBL fold metallo-hydrolase [Deferrisomatales bacterium]
MPEPSRGAGPAAGTPGGGPAGTEILEGLFFIERGYLSGNHFACRSPAPVLIDTAYASEIPKTLAGLDALGVPWRETRLIISTHAHCDHVGANRAIQGASGCEIALHAAGKAFLDAGDRRGPWWDYYHQEAAPFACTRALEDGEEIPVGPHRFRLLHTPGHAADGIVLYEPHAKVLLSSDTLWERDIPVITEAVEGDGALDALLGSLERLEALEVRRVFPGHGRPFSDMRGALARARARLAAYGADRRRVGEDLVKRILVYTLLMRGDFAEEELLPHLLGTAWFPDTVVRYFGPGRERETYRETVGALQRRGALRREGGRILTTVRP